MSDDVKITVTSSITMGGKTTSTVRYYHVTKEKAQEIRDFFRKLENKRKVVEEKNRNRRTNSTLKDSI